MARSATTILERLLTKEADIMRKNILFFVIFLPPDLLW
jgi:hypothetical protein